ncbi:MAG: Na+/H+ antiporter NhaA [Bacteroidota bacterium]
MLFRKNEAHEIKNSLVSLRAPFVRFANIEALGGILLLISTFSALLLANSQWGGAYEDFWNQQLIIGTDFFKLEMPLLRWLNDGLMVIFFFLLGLEIKREFIAGELSNIKQSTLPIFASIGGMIVPAGLFIILNYNKTGMEGWGITMATDVTLSLSILALIGRKVPIGLKVFLVGFAIVDNIGAVLKIALSDNALINWEFFGIAGGLLGILVLFNYRNVRYIPAYMVLGWIIWYMFLKSGIHPTMAGILIAFTIPAKRKIKLTEFSVNLRNAVDDFCDQSCHDRIILNNQQLSIIDNIKYYIDRVQSPVQYLENTLHSFVTYIVMPLFLFANAGIVFRGFVLETFNTLTLNIAFAMVFGKLTGILLFSWLSIKFGGASLPKNTNWKHIFGAALLGGAGFTMSLFISNLTFENIILLNEAKLGVLLGSFTASILGLVYLKLTLRKNYAAKHS